MRPIKSSGGFTLIELMIAMLLGLIVIAGVTAVFLAGQRSYRTNQALAEVQDSSRIAFEIMARDIRDAGLTGCGNPGRVGNILSASPAGGGSAWWADWSNVIMGGTKADAAVAAGGASGQRVTGNDSLMLIGAGGQSSSVVTYDFASATFTLSDANADLQAGDVFVVCDPDHAVIAQSATYVSASKTLTYTKDSGNCSTGMGFPSDCASSSNDYQFQKNAQITKLTATDWYIGVNPVGGNSLYRQVLSTNGTLSTQEMVRDVNSMTILYHVPGAATFSSASDVTAAGSWGRVDSVQVSWQVQSVNKTAGTGGQPVSRTFTATTTLRNRVN
ncbi:MAG TPA: PilW family protein [Rhodanobacter sp.]|nr:PilW family protein [Rhodanobacter sp.]